jgi:putative oxidoreductase
MSTTPVPASLDYGRARPESNWSFLAVPGRLLLSAIFLMSGFGKITAFSAMAGMMASKMPAPKLMLALAIVAEIGGGVSLLLGFLSRLGALGLFVYLIPTTLLFHNFWAADAAHQQEQLINFLKNLAIMGGLLMVIAHGAGPLSIYAAMRRRA